MLDRFCPHDKQVSRLPVLKGFPVDEALRLRLTCKIRLPANEVAEATLLVPSVSRNYFCLYDVLYHEDVLISVRDRTGPQSNLYPG